MSNQDNHLSNKFSGFAVISTEKGSVLRMHHFGDVQYKEINRVIGGEPQTETQTILPYTDCKEIAVLGLGTCRKMGPIGNTQEDFELFEQGRAVLRTVYMQLNPIQ